MKINAYKVNDWWWLSPGTVVKAMKAKGKVIIVTHTEDPSPYDASDILCSIASTTFRLANLRLALIRNSLLMAILYVALALVAAWSPLRSMAGGIPSYVALAIVTVGAGSRLVSCLQAVKSKLTNTTFAPTFQTGSGKMLPPLQAYGGIPSLGFPFKRTGVVSLVVLLAIVLNSVVIASPNRPAVIGTRIITGPELVMPGTSWVSRQVWTSNAVYVAFADGGEDTVWAIKIDYTLKQTDLLQTPEDWDQWMMTSMNAVLGRMTQYVWEQNLDPSYTTEQKIADLVAVVEETSQDLEEYMEDQFDGVAEGVILWTIDVELVRLSIPEYAKIYKAQNK